MPENKSYTPLEPNFSNDLGLTSKLEFQPGKETTLFESTSFIYSALLILCIGAAAFVYGRGGLWRMQASESGVKKSNEEFTRATLGLFGVLILFPVLFLLNKDLLTGNIGLEKLKIDQTTSTSSILTSKASSYTNPSIPKNTDDPTGWKAIENDPMVREQLKALSGDGGVGVNRPVCNNPTASGCTIVGGLPPETLSMLGQLRATCTGIIEITGGSETAGHTSHGPGKTPVDISKSKPGDLNNCIATFRKSSRVPTNSMGNPLCYPNKVFENFGYVFCDEQGGAPHWHVYRPAN